jgi:hypothetical protein
MFKNLEIIGRITLLNSKIELETIKVEIADFPFFSHQLLVGLDM